MTGFSDIHSHFVYGIDDGPKTKAEMEAMLDRANAEGIAVLAATPHVAPGLRAFDEALFQLHLDEARRYVRSKGYSMQLVSGAEIFYTPAAVSAVHERRLPSLGGSEFILVEFARDIRFADMLRALQLFERGGYLPVIAHAERYECLRRMRNMRVMRASSSVRVQINANSVISGKGFWETRRLHAWLENGYADLIACDAHGLRHRPFCIKEAYKRIAEEFGQEMADQLTGRR